MLIRTLTQSILCVLFTLPVFASGAEPTKVAYQVICEDQSVNDKISAAIALELKAVNLQIAKRLPRSKLLVYAQQDLNDKVNSEGWSFSIVHVSNAETYFVASKLISSNSEEANAVKPVLLSMIREDGFLTYMNVAHVDRLTPENITTVAHSVVQAFSERVAR